MSADLATLAIRVDGDQATQQVRQFGVESEKTSVKVAGLEATVVGVEGALSKVRTVLGLGLFGFEFLSESIAAQDAMAQLEAGVKSTGGSAGFTAEQLHKQAMAMEELTNFSHNAIESAQAILLLSERLKGTEFEKAELAAANLATRLKTDVADAARQLGKALEDPTTGMNMLRRAGVVFTAGQKDLIQTLQSSGELTKAQTVILDLLATKLGGSAVAARDTLGGALKGLAHDFANLFEIERSGSGIMINSLNDIGLSLRYLREHGEALIDVFIVLGTTYAVDKIVSATTALSAHIIATARARDALITLSESQVAATDTRVVLAKSAQVAALFEADLAKSVLFNAERHRECADGEAEEIATTNALTAAIERNILAQRTAAETTVAVTEANLAAVDAELALSAALTETTVTSRAAAGAMGMLSRSLDLVGGPVGIAVIAMVLALRHAHEASGQAARDATTDLDRYREALERLDAKQIAVQKSALESAIAIEDAQKASVVGQMNALPKAGTPGFDESTSRQMSDLAAQLNSITEVDDRLNAMLGLTKGVMGEVGSATDGASKKLREFLAEHEAEISKLRALNDAYMQSTLALKILDIEKTNAIEKTKAHKDHLQSEWGAIDKTINAMTAQQIIQAKLAATKTETQNLTAQHATNEAMLQGANDAQRLAEAHDGLARAQLLTADAALRANVALEHLQIALDTNKAVTAAGVELKKASAGATDQEKRAAIALYDAKVDGINAERRVKDATVDSSAAMATQTAIIADQIAMNKEYAASKDQMFQEELKAMDAANAVRDNAKKSAVSLVESFFQSASNGATSFWNNFKSSAERTFASLISQKLVQKLFDTSVGFAAIFGGDRTGTTGGLDDSVYTADMLAKGHPASGMMQTAVAGLGIATAGFGVGGLIGSQTTNRGLGALGGAAGGAASGAAIGAMGGPIGVVAGAFIGAAAGAVGGFLGAGHAAAEAAKALLAMQSAEAQVSASLADWRAQITGTATDQAAANAADLRWKYLQLVQTIESVEAGKKMEDQRNKDLQEAADLYGMAQKNLTNTTNNLNSSFAGLIGQVQGYHLDLRQFQYSPALGPQNSAPSTPTPPGQSGNSGGGNGADGTNGGALQNVIVQLMLDGKVIMRNTVKQLQQVSQDNFGTSDRPADAMALL